MNPIRAPRPVVSQALSALMLAATLVLAAFLLGWRALALLLVRVRRRSPAPSRR